MKYNASVKNQSLTYIRKDKNSSKIGLRRHSNKVEAVGKRDGSSGAAPKKMHNNFNQIMNYALQLMRNDDEHIRQMR